MAVQMLSCLFSMLPVPYVYQNSRNAPAIASTNPGRKLRAISPPAMVVHAFYQGVGEDGPFGDRRRQIPCRHARRAPASTGMRFSSRLNFSADVSPSGGASASSGQRGIATHGKGAEGEGDQRRNQGGVPAS